MFCELNAVTTRNPFGENKCFNKYREGVSGSKGVKRHLQNCYNYVSCEFDEFRVDVHLRKLRGLRDTMFPKKKNSLGSYLCDSY